MATIDLSRSSTEFRKHFTSVRAQMGRVFTDDDHNDNERLHGEDERRARLDIIGPSGSPDAGFLITNPRVTNGKIDFDITHGTFYLGGHCLDLEQDEQFQEQSDWLNMSPADMPVPPANTSRFDLVYLECWQQPVSAVEDSELFEIALGGPDTSVRMRLMRRVHVFADSQTGDCHQDWANLTAQWAANGLGTLDKHNELVVDTKLTVGFEAGSDKSDLCSPPVAGGYLGAENQAIRVQLVDATHFIWGFDNAAPLYRVTIGPNSGGQLRKVTMLTEPKDQAHWPVAGQVVELLPWSAVLSNNEKVSEVSGFLARVDASYDPDTKEFFLAASVPAGFGEDWLTRLDANDLKPEFFYMRLWNRGSDTTSPVSIPFSTTPVALGNSGLNVTFSGSDHHPADYWIIAARPASPNRVVPWLLEAGRGPHGIHRYYAPLGVIEWTPGGNNAQGTVIHDCREKFPPLTRIRTCCTYTVGDGTHSFGNFTSIQDAINSLPADGGEICLLPGVYTQHFEIINRHDISVHGCGSHTVLMDDGHTKSPVITIKDSQRIEIRDLAVEALAVIGIQLASSTSAEQRNPGLQYIDLDNLTIAARDQSAIECRGGRFIRVRRNDIEARQLMGSLDNQSTIGKSPLVFIRADDVLVELNRLAAVAVAERRLVLASGGLHLGGGSERVEVRRNRILGGNSNGITLGSITFVGQTNDNVPGGVRRILFFPTFGFVVDAAGCIHPDPDPQDPIDPSGIRLVPVSDGDLTDIRILENDILDMGLNGISTLRYFKQEVGPIVVRGLDVEGNRIRRCLQLDLGNQPFGQGPAIGFGGVSLVSAEEFTLCHNWIESNGTSFVEPICGVFVGSVRGLCIENNRIADNGPLVNTNRQPTAGPRGGIVVQLARTPLVEVGMRAERMVSREGFPAARIAGNTVIVPLGRALWLVAHGLVAVEGNEFTSRGVDRDNNPHGVTVTILNTGIAYEAGQFIGFANMGKHQPTGGPSWEEALAASSFIGGKILFNNNQVLLAPQGGGDETIASSILILTADDALLDGNQSECRLAQQTLQANGLVFGWSTRVTDNRFEERLLSPGVSALTLAVLNCTTDNQGTRCFIVIGIPALTVRTSNRSLIDLFNTQVCQSLSAAVAAALRGSGFDA
jgi:hypothetical protein